MLCRLCQTLHGSGHELVLKFKADGVNVHIIPAYVGWFFNYAPFECWGSEEKMNAWLDKRKEELE